MIKRIINNAVFFIVLILAIILTAGAVQRKDSKREYNEFYQNKNKVDVLFMGSSHVLYSVLPMELWQEYGIATYNMGEAQSTIPEVYWTLKNVLDYQSPKLVVVDLYNLEQNEKVIEEKYLHNYTDTLPLSQNKIEMIYDLIPKGGRSEFLFDFSLYHNRWSELDEKDFLQEKSVEKGADTTVMDIYPTDGPDMSINNSEYNCLETVGTEYLDRLAELCKQRDIQLLFIYMPYGQADERVLKNANYGYVLAEKYGVSYLNLMYEKDLIDYRIDCSDANSHLNPAGSKKVTMYLGKYITENYELPCHFGDATYQNWNTDALAYIELKAERLKQSSHLERYLMLLNDKQFYTELIIGNNCELDETNRLLIQALKTSEDSIQRDDSDNVTIRVWLQETDQMVDEATFHNSGEGFLKINE